MESQSIIKILFITLRQSTINRKELTLDLKMSDEVRENHKIVVHLPSGDSLYFNEAFIDGNEILKKVCDDARFSSFFS